MTAEQHIVDVLLELVASHRREIDTSLAALKELGEAHRAGDTEAVTKAFAAAGELSKAHNDLLRKMEKLSETFATKDAIRAELETLERASEKRFGRLEAWQAKVSGGLLVVAAVGLANFVKLWTG